MIKSNTKIVILAGGKGKRFNPFSFVIPKPLMPINQNPILMYLINAFKKNNFKNFFISTGYQAELIKAYLGTGKKLGVKVKYFNENKPLGTAGPLNTMKKIIKKNDYFFLINGDVYTELNFKKMMSFAKKNNFDLVIGSIKKKYKNSFGILDIKNNKVKRITEKPNSFFNINSGIYIIKNTNNLNLIPKNKFFTMPNLIEKYISKGLSVGAYNIKDYWLGIENVENLKKVEKRLKNILKMVEKKILIIIPTYNEGLIIGNILSELKETFINVDILVIDGYSSDRTFDEVKKYNVNIIQVDKRFGISLAIETGILFAYKKKYDLLVRIDGDGQHSPSDAKKLLDFAIINKSDLTIGSRFLNKSEYSPNNLRLYSIKFLRILIKIFYKTEVTDCTSGCQILSKKLIKELCDDELFEYSEVGIICQASRLKMTIKEKFINMKQRKTGTSSFNLKNSFIYMFKNILILLTLIKFKHKK